MPHLFKPVRLNAMDIHQCPRCELRFISRSELEDHLSEAHLTQEENDQTNPDSKSDEH